MAALRQEAARGPTAETSLMLDLGRCSGSHRELGERPGFHWVGLDCDGPGAPTLGDARALP